MGATKRRFALKAHPYGAVVEFLVGHSPAELQRALAVDDLQDDGQLGRFFVGGARRVVWLRSWRGRVADHGVLVHELAHAAFSVLDHAGVPLTVEGDEAVAYLLEDLYTRAATKLRGRR